MTLMLCARTLNLSASFYRHLVSPIMHQAKHLGDIQTGGLFIFDI